MAQILISRESPLKLEGVNKIKGLNMQNAGYRVRKVDLGCSSFCIKGTKIK